MTVVSLVKQVLDLIKGWASQQEQLDEMKTQLDRIEAAVTLAQDGGATSVGITLGDPVKQ